MTDGGRVDHDGWGAGPYTRALVLVVLFAVPLAALLLRAGPDDQPVDPVPDRGLEVPLLSARRIGPGLVRTAGDLLLDEQVDALFEAVPPTSCLALRPGGTGPVRTRGTDEALVPASLVKLLVTSTALDTFGPDHRFTTRVIATGTGGGGTVGDGTVGNLYLVGGGDPFLATTGWAEFSDLPEPLASFTSLEALADDVVRAGVTRVEGSIIGDGSHFGAGVDEVGRVDQVGEFGQFGRIDERGTLVSTGPITALLVDEGYARWPTGPDTIAGQAEPADDVTSHAATVFAQLLIDRGVAVANPEGSVGTSPDPDTEGTAEVASIRSAPLDQIVTTTNTFSSNLGAQVLFRHIGLAHRGTGSNAEAADATKAHLAQLGHPVDGLTLVDGIGLSNENRLTCRLLLSILTAAGPDSPLADSLAIAGVRGTAGSRFPNPELRGLIRAKTGTLSGSRALAGFARSWVDGGETPFVLIVNTEGLSYDEFDPWSRAVQDDLLVMLAQLPCVPDRATVDDLLAPVQVQQPGEPPAGPDPKPQGIPDQGDRVNDRADTPQTPDGRDEESRPDQDEIDRWNADPDEAGCDDGQRIHEYDLIGYLVEIRYSPSCDTMWARATFHAIESGAAKLHLIGYSCTEADTVCRSQIQSVALNSNHSCIGEVDESGTCALPDPGQIWTHMLSAKLTNLRACVSLAPQPGTEDLAVLDVDACTPPAFEFRSTGAGEIRSLSRPRSACRWPDSTALGAPTG